MHQRGTIQRNSCQDACLLHAANTPTRMLSIVRSGGEPAGVESFIILTNGISLGAKASMNLSGRGLETWLSAHEDWMLSSIDGRMFAEVRTDHPKLVATRVSVHSAYLPLNVARQGRVVLAGGRGSRQNNDTAFQTSRFSRATSGFADFRRGSRLRIISGETIRIWITRPEVRK